MISFRPLPKERRPLPDDVVPLLTEIWQPIHFVLPGDLRCAWQFEAEQELPWEIFRGRLVEARHCRQTRRFLCWNLLPVADGRVADEPLLSMLFDEAERTLHVTRGLLCRVWMPGESDLVGETTEAWVRELVGTFALADTDSREAFVDEVRSLLWHAVVGVSRLPLTSLEAPLPQFTFGQMHYAPTEVVGDSSRPHRSCLDFMERTPAEELLEREIAKFLEAILRSAPRDQLAIHAEAAAEWIGDHALPAVFRRMFNDVSLSPYTDFVDRALECVSLWRPRLPPHADTDLFASLALTITRHLTAYDLVLFHYRGANFPDALLLDALLRQMLGQARSAPDAFLDETDAGRRRRRALRMALLARSHYEGHAVPDRPTSPGENQRVYPASHPVTPEEQIENPARRPRKLFDDGPLSLEGLEPIMELMLAEAGDDRELFELGAALMIDRPLGYFKAPAETDLTPLLSYEAWSRRVTIRRLWALERLSAKWGLRPFDWEAFRERAQTMPSRGVSVDRIPEPRRPAVSLADARKVSDDFTIVRTMPRSLHEFWNALSVEPGDWPLFMRVLDERGEPVLAAFDADGFVRKTFEADWSRGGDVRAGVEIPGAGLCER